MVTCDKTGGGGEDENMGIAELKLEKARVRRKGWQPRRKTERQNSSRGRQFFPAAFRATIHELNSFVWIRICNSPKYSMHMLLCLLVESARDCPFLKPLPDRRITAPCKTSFRTPFLSERSKNASDEIDAKPTFQLPTNYSITTYYSDF
jgi:hypothetical protein